MSKRVTLPPSMREWVICKRTNNKRNVFDDDREYFHHPESFSNTLESSVIESIMSSPKESLITKSIVSISTHWILTMPIDFVIRDPSRILLTHQIMTMPIDSIIKDLSRVLLTHRIVPMPIDSVIGDSSRGVMHPPNPSIWKSNGPGPPFPWWSITLDST